MSDLRAELLQGTSPTLPPYRMLLPPGWVVFDLGEEDEGKVMAQATARLQAGGRPELAATLGRHVRDALANLRRQNGVIYAVPGEGSPTWVLGSASLIGIRRVSTPEATLDDMVMSVVANHGAAPLDEAGRIMQWVEHRRVTLDGANARSLVLNYLIPVPGTRRTQAVHWIVNAAYPEEFPEDAPSLEGWRALFDAHVATFAWMPA